MKRVSIFVILVLTTGMLFAQYNERQIMSQEAYQLLARRQFSEAEQIFKQILLQYPDDLNSVLQLFQIYLQTSQLDKAEAVLSEHRRIIPDAHYQEQSILLLIHQGRSEQAFSASRTYLERLNHDQNKYRLLASYFEQRSFFGESLQLYQNARIVLNNPSLFTLEIANAALRYRQLETATLEYLKWLEMSPNNLFFVVNQIKSILSDAPQFIDVIGQVAESKDLEQIWDLYAQSLVHLNRFDEALTAFRRLPPAKLHSFAEQQYVANNFDIALPAFKLLQVRNSDTIAASDYRLREAQILYKIDLPDSSAAVLDSLLNDPILLQPRIRNRIQAHFQGRKLLAEIQVYQEAPKDSVLKTLTSMQSYARNPQEQSEAALLTAKYLIMNSDYDVAESHLARVSLTAYLHERDFYRYLSQLLRGNLDEADSLMNEFVILHPSSAWVNDAMYLMMLYYSLEADQQSLLSSAYRDFHLHRNSAVDTLVQLHASSSEEEFLILAAEWAFALGDNQRALEILRHPFTDSVSAEYAGFLSLIYTQDKTAKERIAREFLSQNPSSVFSPGFRAIFSSLPGNRPQF